MNTVIVGAGVVGVALAEQLSLEGHKVTIVDQDRHKIQQICDKLDVLAVRGNASSPSVLERAGIRDAEMVIAVTDVDEVNLVVGMLAARLGVARRIVRVRNREYLNEDCILSPEELDIDHVINPDPAIVDALVQMIEIPGTNDVATLAHGQVLLLAFDVTPDSPAAGRTPAELREAGEMDAFLILYITRGDTAIVPKGDDRLLPGDKVHVLVAADLVQFLVPVFNRHPPGVRRIIIAGASRLGRQLCEALETRMSRVILIEPDAEHASETAGELKKTTVLHGDATNTEVLTEASADQCDLFCAVSDNDQTNMLSAMLAKKHGAKKVAVLLQSPDYVPLMNSLGADIVINPRLVTVGQILMHVRRGHILSVTRLAESHAELIEMEVPAGSPVCASPLKNIKFPRNALVAAIIRDGNLEIPSGETQIHPGETVIVYALPDAIAGIEKLFSHKRK